MNGESKVEKHSELIFYKLKETLCRFIAIETAINNAGSKGNQTGLPWDWRPML